MLKRLSVINYPHDVVTKLANDYINCKCSLSSSKPLLGKFSLFRKMMYFVQCPTLQLLIGFFHASSIFLLKKLTGNW